MGEKIQKVAGKNWRTNVAATIALVMTILAAVKAVAEGNLAHVDWSTVIQAGIGLAATFGLYSARDKNVSSEDMGLPGHTPMDTPK